MTTSKHRLSKADRRTIMETVYPLDDLEGLYLSWYRSYGSITATANRYAETFKMLRQFAGTRPLDSRLLTTEAVREFATWLRDTPTRGQLGSTKRSEVSPTEVSINTDKMLTVFD